MAKEPSGPIRIKMYEVGFGDCFLLSVPYGPEKQDERHVLIDFGTMRGASTSHMRKVALDIQASCGGKLTAVVATHRHQDHISGFATGKDGKASGDIIRDLAPELVIQPWTEHPDADPHATEPPRRRAGEHIQMLAARQDRMAQLAPLLAAHKDLPEELAYVAGNNLKNVSAVENLMAMGKAGSAEYVYHGFKSRLSKLLPGVQVSILGPPTLEQTDTIATQASKNEAEFWMLRAAAASSAGPLLAPRASGGKPASLPFRARWVIAQLKGITEAEIASIVEDLDGAMNNTSVILLLQCGEQKLLFPGDAQLENWQYALAQKGAQEALRDVTVYKVGHHGSRNATPRSLWDLFVNRKAHHGPGLTSLVSTLSELNGKPVHGSKKNRSEVPRRTLIEALEKDGALHSTEEYRGKELAREY